MKSLWSVMVVSLTLTHGAVPLPKGFRCPPAAPGCLGTPSCRAGFAFFVYWVVGGGGGGGYGDAAADYMRDAGSGTTLIRNRVRISKDRREKNHSISTSRRDLGSLMWLYIIA